MLHLYSPLVTIASFNTVSGSCSYFQQDWHVCVGDGESSVKKTVPRMIWSVSVDKFP